MATFDEPCQGGTMIGGSVTPTQTQRRQTYFGPGDTAFNRRKARQGVLERVIIRKRKLLWLGRTQSVLYTDTMNGIWNEVDLVDFRTATEIVAEAKLAQSVKNNDVPLC